MPVQYLASEFDLFWHGVSDAQPRFDQFVKLFSSSPSVEAKLLRGGGHNYEFSKNSQELHSLRYQFISRMVGLLQNDWEVLRAKNSDSQKRTPQAAQSHLLLLLSLFSISLTLCLPQLSKPSWRIFEKPWSMSAFSISKTPRYRLIPRSSCPRKPTSFSTCR